MRTFNLLVALFAIVQMLRYARRAALFVVPSVRVSGEPGATPRSAARLRVGAALEELGFAPLGIRRERSPLGAHDVEADAYADPSRGTYADVFQARGSEAPRVVFFTPFRDGAAVLTANFARPAVTTPLVQAGGLANARVEAQLAAHEVAVERFAAAHGTPAVATTLDARLGAARAWYEAEGRRELRRSSAMAFGLVLFAAVLLASAVNILLGGAR
ncbi:MAG TPA: hypothetical protein VF904_00250 [Anaeromyxobacteraceae bacterium]